MGIPVMTNMFYDNHASLEQLHGKKIAILGYGSQGHAHAQNLRDSGCNVVVGLYPESKSCNVASGDGFKVIDVETAVRLSDIIVVLVPDMVQAQLYHESILPNMDDTKTLLFAHGFAIRYGLIDPPPEVNIGLVAPKSPGHRVREVYRDGGGVPALIAVEQDPSGDTHALCLAYAKALGCTRAGVLETTFREETETDLFGEQAVLCGGVTELVKAGFDTLVDAGYQPEVAYFECLHELKLIVDLMYRGGLGYMRHSISDTAEFGDYTAGKRVVGAEARSVMKTILREIQDGTFARSWIDESSTGRMSMLQRRQDESKHQLEQVGTKLRAMMQSGIRVDK